MSTGDPISVGDFIGTVTVADDHLHLREATSNILEDLTPFIDTTDPIIFAQSFRRDPHNFDTSGAIENSNDLSGKIDIVVNANDTRLNALGAADGGATAPHSIQYELLSVDGTVVDTVSNFNFSTLPQNALAPEIFGVGSTISNFNWIITNHPNPAAATPANRFWNTEGRDAVFETWSNSPGNDAREVQEAKYKDGFYQVRVRISDLTPNQAEATYDAIVNNFRPYVKKLMIGGTTKYNAEWKYDDTSNKLSFLTNSNQFLGPGVHTIIVEFSEPVRDTPVLEIAGFTTGLSVLSSTQPVNGRKVWTATLTLVASDNSHDGIQQVTIRAVNDLSGTVGELLDGQPNSIALRDDAGTFIDADNGGNEDKLHKIKIDTKAPQASITVTTN